MGLGLSLAYSSVRSFGGNIVIGNAAEGAVVRITLPVLATPGHGSSAGALPA